ncbi:DMT family transporter [Tumidithrix elongata RA019]|uniref:DMT family transporter n=1 Tax=Tumidithrix elongata BACA0141 TaxID=2716417 RepID=A0AAW9Q5B9_9CYAN|nr:DMT family transporter [Tumidithrix elongata RA019]
MQPNPAKLELAKSPIFLIAPFFFLGTSMVAMKAAIPDTTPLFLASFRLVPAGILILALTLFLKLPQPKTWKAWLWIGLFALVDGAMFQGFLTEGLVNTGAGLGAVLIDAQPLVVAVLARLLFGDVVGLWGWLGLAIGFVGICLCGLPEAWVMSLLHGDLSFLQGGYFLRPENLLHSGELLMLLAALSMSLGTITIRYVKKHVDAVVATGWHMVLGGLPLFALSMFRESNQITHLSNGDWLGLGYAMLFGTALTYGMFFYLASVGNLTSVSALIFLTPIFAMLFSSIFLGETLTQLQWIGVSLSLVGVIVVVQRDAIASQWSLLLEKMGKSPVVALVTANEETSKE